MAGLIPDRYGVGVQAAGAAGVAALDAAVQTLVGLEGDPVDAVAAASAGPAPVLGRCLAAYLHCYSGTRAGYAAARAVLDSVPGQRAPRERAHLAAARSWAAGEIEAAARHLERALLASPRDLLALKVAQDLYFMLGDSIGLRDVAARVLPAWPAGSPGSGYVHGMYAFGLEECGDYRAAERHGRAALAACPTDAWAAHAVIHVHEMEGRAAEGLAFAASSSPGWAPSFFAVHNWWHTGLYHLQLCQLDDALAVYDEKMRTLGLASPLGQLDAASLLWRLWLQGADIRAPVPGRAGDGDGDGSASDGNSGAGQRASELADAFEPRLADSAYCFNDWHAAMALCLAGRAEAAEALAAELPGRAAGTNKVMLERAGLDVIRGVIAYARCQYPLAVELLARARPHASVIGGSHAQRDAIDLTLLAAAAAAAAETAAGAAAGATEPATAAATGDDVPYDALVRALVAERTARSPAASLAARLVIGASHARATARQLSARQLSARQLSARQHGELENADQPGRARRHGAPRGNTPDGVTAPNHSTATATATDVRT